MTGDGSVRLLVAGRATLSASCGGRRVVLAEMAAPALLPGPRAAIDVRLSSDAETSDIGDADLLGPVLATARALAPVFGRRAEKPRPSRLTKPGLEAVLGPGQSLGAGGHHAFVRIGDGTTRLLVGARVMTGAAAIAFSVVEDGTVGPAALLAAADDLVGAALATAETTATAAWRQEIDAHDEAQHVDRQRVATAADGLRRLLSDGRLDETIAPVAGQGDLWANVLRLVARADGINTGPLPLSLPDGPLSAQGLDLALRPHGLRLRRQRLPEQWWRAADFMPQVGLTAEGGRPLALLPGRRGCRIVDGEGRTVADPVDAEAATNVQPHGFALIPRLAPGRERFRDLLVLAMRRGRREARAALLSTLVVTAAQTMITAATLLITASLIPDRRMEPVLALAGGIGTFTLCLVFLQVTTGLRQMRFGAVTGLAAEAAVLDRLADRGDMIDTKATGGDLALRLSSTGSLAAVYAGTLMGGGIGLATCLYGVAMAAVIAPMAGLAVAALVLCWLGAGVIAGLAERRAFTGGSAASASAFGLAQQIVGHVGTIRAGGASLRALDRWLGAYVPLRAKLIAMRRASDGFSVAVAGFGLLAGALFYGFVLLGRGEAVSPAAFVALVSAFAFANGGAVALAQAIRQALSNLPMLALVRPLLKSAPPRGREAPPGRLTGEIALRHVGAAYQGQGRAALVDVSAAIPAGGYIGITGPSGGGKTTLIKAILGLVPLAAGQITVDGRDITRLDMAALRRQVALVLADAQAVRGTIFDNIRCLHDVDLDGAWRAAERAGLAAEIRAMPMGMFTLVGERGGGLSGGQLQRLLIARALAGDPAILVFDEATSALDAEAQAIVLDTLRGLAVTRIVVSHRLETLRDTGQILVIADGRLVQQGDFPTLAATQGVFAHLAGLQAPAPKGRGEAPRERKNDA